MSQSDTRRLLVISPVRNEEQYLERCIEAVVRQSLRPTVWIIVDDGSNDGTRVIAQRAAERHDWIRLVCRLDRGSRAVGAGVVDAFLDGYAEGASVRSDYVCKLDADIVLPGTYFETVIERMDAQPRLGSASGKPYYVNETGARVSERIGDDVSVGAVKMYKRRCLEQIGGLVRGVMWDGIDCHRARIMGWCVRSWDDPAVSFEHLRPMGASERGIVVGRIRWGRGQYYMGTGPVWMIVSATYRMLTPPLLIGGVAMLWGYLSSAVSRAQRLADPELRQFLGVYHRMALLRGKAFARDFVESAGAAVWAPDGQSKWLSTLPQVKESMSDTPT